MRTRLPTGARRASGPGPTIRLGFLAVLAVMLSPTALPAQVPGAEAARVERVIASLRYPVEVAGQAPRVFALAERMEALHVPGVSVAVLDSGRISWARGWGVRRAGGTDPVTPETLFQAASISKPVAAVGLLRMVDREVLELDGNVTRVLRSWTLPANRYTLRDSVTFRRLVSHTAGLTVHGFPGYRPGLGLPTLGQILSGQRPANTGPVVADTIPGSRWKYSGGGYTILQVAMADATGQAFDDLMHDLVLAPAGMHHSTYSQPLPKHRAANAASGHRRDGSVVPGEWHVYPEQAAAGLWTTPADLARLAMALWRAEQGASDFLAPATLREMFTVQQAPSGLGFMLAGEGDTQRFEHGGANEGFRAQFTAFRHRGQGAVIMTNGDRGHQLAQELLYAIAAEYDWPDLAPRQVEEAAVAPELLQATAGRYRIMGPGNRVAEIGVDRGRLWLEVAGAVARTPLVAVDDRTFVALETGLEIRVDRETSGRGAAFTAMGTRAIRIE